MKFLASLIAAGLSSFTAPIFAAADNASGTNGDLALDPVNYVLIHEIQGDGASSPMDGQTVTIEAIVVGDFQNNELSDNGDLKGFYVQEEDIDADNDNNTSEGLFVYDGSGDIDVEIGDKVLVTGAVKEYFGLTEISATNVTVLSKAWPLPTVTEMVLPVASSDAFEAVEGMYVRFPQALMISEYYNFDRFGEIVLAQPLDGEPRPMTPTAMEQPGSEAYQARTQANLLSRITLDDGRTSQNPDPVHHPNGEIFTLDNRFRGGDQVKNSSGILDYRYSLYRLQPTQPATYLSSNSRPESVPDVGEGLKVASFNVLNYFTTLDEAGNLCGPDNNLGCRGADNFEEFMRQRDKIIQAIASIDADIVGLNEIENNPSAAVDDLLDGLNEVMGDNSYDKVDSGIIGGDAIKVAFIYKPGTVAPMGDYAILDSSVDSRFIDNKNRPVLAQTFVSLNNAGRLTVAVNHLKSKGSPCDDIGDQDQLDGQGNCNLTRTKAAAALSDWLASDPTGKGDADKLIIGDLNAYDKEDPVSTLINAGYTDLLLRDEGETAYTYVFNGQFGYLDYALANETLAAQVTATKVWHINADEPDILDYDTSFKKPAQDLLYEANAFRSSDHDPVIIGLELQASIDDIRLFIDAAIDSGQLYGKGKHPDKSLKGFLKIMQQTSAMAERKKNHKACVLLKKALRFLDADDDKHSSAHIQGNAVATIENMLDEYLEQNCHQSS